MHGDLWYKKKHSWLTEIECCVSLVRVWDVCEKPQGFIPNMVYCVMSLWHFIPITPVHSAVKWVPAMLESLIQIVQGLYWIFRRIQQIKIRTSLVMVMPLESSPYSVLILKRTLPSKGWLNVYLNLQLKKKKDCCIIHCRLHDKKLYHFLFFTF